MNPTLETHNIKARCPDCNGAVTSFLFRNESREYGHFVEQMEPIFKDKIGYNRTLYRLLRCAGCGRGGMYKSYMRTSGGGELLLDFYPTTSEIGRIPTGVPEGIVAEFREAEKCVSVGAWRAGSALLRSTIEKVLKDNGYAKGDLKSKIDLAASDGLITDSRKKRAHEDIRVLGNDILHDEWKSVNQEEYEVAHHYAQRIIEDFYDDRASVTVLLKAKGRIP